MRLRTAVRLFDQEDGSVKRTLATLAAGLWILLATPAVSAHEPHYGKVEIDPSCGGVTLDFALKDADEVGWQIWRGSGRYRILVNAGHHAAPDGLYTVTIPLPFRLGTTVYELRFDDEPVDASYQSEPFEVDCTEDDQSPTPTPTSTPALTPSPTPTITPSPTPTATQPGSTPTPTASGTPIPTQTPAPTPTHSPGTARSTLPPTETADRSEPAQPIVPIGLALILATSLVIVWYELKRRNR